MSENPSVDDLNHLDQKEISRNILIFASQQPVLVENAM